MLHYPQKGDPNEEENPVGCCLRSSGRRPSWRSASGRLLRRLPGISFSGNGSDPVGIGDNTATGAQASSTKGNNALAISMFQPSVASSGDNANGNNLLAVDGSAGAGLNAKGNNVVAVGGVSEVTDDAEGNTIVNVGGKVTASGNATNAVSVSACNTSFTGQADHVT